MSTTTLQLDQRVHQAIGDWLEFDTTTDITTNNLIKSTALNEYDSSEDDHFNDYFWCYITEGNNIDKDRQVTDYATATGQLTVRGAALVAEAGAVTVRLYRYSYTKTLRAINDALREIFPALYKPVLDTTLVTGNLLPDGSFEDWTSATALRFYSSLSGAQAQTTTAGLYRGMRGSTSVKYTAGAANDYLYISSDTYPRLLDLQGQSVSLKCWAYPQTADDAYVAIYTVQADGTAQTLTSTTTCPAGKWTLLELEDQELNDNLDEIQIRFKVATSGQYVYFDSARLTGIDVQDYLLPDNLQSGNISQAYIQVGGRSDDACDDINPQWYPINMETYHDGTYKWLYLPDKPTAKRLLKLVGYAPFTTLTNYASTIPVDDEGKLRLITALAASKLFQQEAGLASSEDRIRLKELQFEWEREYRTLKATNLMITPTHQLIGNTYG